MLGNKNVLSHSKHMESEYLVERSIGGVRRWWMAVFAKGKPPHGILSESDQSIYKKNYIFLY